MSERDQTTAEDVFGFILQPTYRIESGRPVVHLYGRLERGETFLVRDDRTRPHFWVRASDEAEARRLGARPLKASGRRTMAGEPALRVELPTPPDTPPLRDKLTAAGVACFEADLRFAQRFLIDRGLRGALRIRGPSRRGEGVDRVFENPTLEPARWSPELKVLSFDIETDPSARRLLSIALYGCGAAEVLLFCPEGYERPPSALGFSSERALLAAFCQRVAELDPDLLLGWNVIDFDLTVLERIGQRVGLTLTLGRGGERLRLRPSRGRAQSQEALVTGRIVLDGIQLLRGAFIKMESYALDQVAREVLGEGKVELTDEGSPGAGRAGEILRLFKEDRGRLVAYNLTDARLALEIVERLELVELALARSQLTGLPLDRVSSSIAAFDFLYLTELGRLGVVAPTVAGVDRDQSPQTLTGGQVLPPVQGLHRNVLVFDFKSLYPSLIRTFQIDPLGYHQALGAGGGGGPSVITAPNGATFDRAPSILAGLLDELVPRREAAKAAGDHVASHAIKILMNSFYGVLGAPSCRFFEPELSNAITGFGREVLLWSVERVEARGHRVLYGDTDSLFVDAGLDTAEEARALGRALVGELNDELAVHLEARYGVESRLELELEGLYLRLFLPTVRGRAGDDAVGARKRYAGLLDAEPEPELVLTGLEAVRRDWTALARAVQRELYRRLFADQPVEEYLRKVVVELRAGLHDDRLIYRKALRKAPEAYTSTTPPHVAAARKLPGPPPRLIEYVMTLDGPEPLAQRRHELDHEHYVDRQLRPVAEPVLTLLGLDFKEIVGDERQISLF